MADSSLSYAEYTGDGVTKDFALSVSGEDIGYIRTGDIHGYVDAVEVSVSVDVNTPHIVTFESAPALGSSILIRREMEDESPYVTFQRGSDFSNTNVNNSLRHLLYLIQEWRNGFLPSYHSLKSDLDAGDNIITNVKSPELGSDAVNLETLESYSADLTAALEAAIAAQGAVDASQDSVTQNISDRVLTLEGGSEVTIGTSYRYPIKRTAQEGQTTFDLVLDVDTNSIVSINGATQVPLEAYEINGNTLTFAEGLEEGDVVLVLAGFDYSPVEVVGEGDWVYSATGGEVVLDTTTAFDSILLFINGVAQTPNYAFSASGTVITLAEALEAGDLVYAILKNT
ncbi:tail fiber protein [Marinomonas phage CB5A]|uniref:Tail fibers protein n=1 Tax=Marinomonas phage CB5A TaxID=2022859 RepID=A0A222G2V6_9CAUD|nr:tail fiber protein [Marinomonas phage CB5A]ASP46265.1 tail fibers protein [Marinomonas phage CB5A]